MSSPSPETRRDFLTVVGDLALLTREMAETVALEAEKRNVLPSQLALQRGLLDAVQVDIVETLLHPEEVIPGYDILDVLGHGGMGVVYRARQKNLDRVVALKTVLVSMMADSGAVSRFEREALSVAKLRHPNVVAAHDFGRHDGRLYFAMEFVEGEDLEDFIDVRGQLDEATAWGLARQAAAGLAHALKQGIVHRDIKPANLLLIAPPEGFPLPPGMRMVKIADFGLAFLTAESEARTRLTAAGKTVGSPHYIAPELLSGATADQRADIYSLGATVYHMIAGKAPFGGLALTQILTQKISGNVPSLAADCPGVSEATDQLVAEMMAHDAAGRPGDYSELLRRIDSLSPPGSGSLDATTALPLSDTAHLGEVRKRSGEVPTQPYSTTMEVDRPRSSSRRRWLTIGLATAAIAACLALGIVFWPEASPKPSPPQKRDMVNAGWGEWLFNGQSIDGWLSRGGTWRQDQDEEGAGVISGAKGLFRRSLPRGKDGRPPRFFRLEAVARLHQADSVELHFGIAAAADEDGPRYAVRVTQDAAVLGRRQSNHGTFAPLAKKRALKVGPKDLLAIVVELQYGHWWVTLQGPRGKHELGYVPVRRERQLAEIRLYAEGGPESPAWFSDIRLDALKAP